MKRSYLFVASTQKELPMQLLAQIGVRLAQSPTTDDEGFRRLFEQTVKEFPPSELRVAYKHYDDLKAKYLPNNLKTA